MLSISHVHGKHSTWKERGGDPLAGTAVTLNLFFWIYGELYGHWDIPKQKIRTKKVMAIAM